jgi:hypothetical protein
MSERHNFWYNKKFLIPTLVILSSVFLLPQILLAADLRVVTDRSTYNVGDTVVANIILASASQASNAVSGTLNFPRESLQVTSLSKSGSVVNLWVQEPAYSNSGGQVSFEGAILNPGFTGGSGRVLSVNFKARQAGTASLSFSTGSILANDGEGTSILKTLGRTSITILAAKVVEKKVAPVSPTVKLSKVVATATPAIIEPPELEINELKTAEASNHTRFIIVGSSRNSAIDRYEIQLDDGTTLILPGRNAPTYNTPALEAGEHLIIVTAVDLLGNRTERQLTFSISPSLSRGTLFKWGNSLIVVLSVLVPLAILLTILILLFSSTKQNITFLKRRLRKEVLEAEAGLHKAFDFMRDDLQNQVLLLDKTKSKRKLSPAESRLLKTLKNDLAQAEKFIKKEIEDINKQVK